MGARRNSAIDFRSWNYDKSQISFSAEDKAFPTKRAEIFLRRGKFQRLFQSA
jgi:hypothetical protein